ASLRRELRRSRACRVMASSSCISQASFSVSLAVARMASMTRSDGLVASRCARRRPTRPSFKLPGECGGIFRAVIIKKIGRKILVRKILVRKILVRKILVRKILVRKILVRKILVRKILVRKILGHLIAVAAPETVL